MRARIFICIRLFVPILLYSCSSFKQQAIEKNPADLLTHSPVFSQHFTGFSLFDLEENRFISSVNATKCFTPASNIKLLTMYAVLKSFNDSIPGLIYKKNEEATFVLPVGDPSFLHREFQHQKVWEFLARQPAIVIQTPKEALLPFGSGWAWDDYVFDFQPERSWWPIYGNVIQVKKSDSIIQITPTFFRDFVEIRRQEKSGDLLDRALHYNQFTAYVESDTSGFERIMPFQHSDELLKRLLEDTLNVSINYTEEIAIPLTDTLYSQALDVILAKMMKPSDNFLAEQLLIMAAHKHGFSQIKPFITYVQTTWLTDLNEMVWVDGSGLSRYNLIAPEDQVKLLKKCLDEFGWERITRILPSGGEGTLEELYVADEPFLYAKTGTLSNNHNLSGFLIAKSGKRLIFSFMNNHYVRPTQEIKKAMEDFLRKVRDTY